MPDTGRLFLTMNRAIDERYDPVLAARGATRYFRRAYRRLRDWGLAVTSYNHGIAGMSRALDLYGPDIAGIVRHYQGPGFGFASRNFYAEFLAVRRIFRHLPRHFPAGVRFEPLLQAERIRLERPTTVGELASAYGQDSARLAAFNPAWTEVATKDLEPLPSGSDIWMPKNMVQEER
jgi:membrane-bound lytic murein transglycosylase D